MKKKIKWKLYTVPVGVCVGDNDGAVLGGLLGEVVGVLLGELLGSLVGMSNITQARIIEMPYDAISSNQEKKINIKLTVHTCRHTRWGVGW